MAFVPFKGFGKYGVVHDSPDEALPLGVWSNARNIRFSGIQMEKMLEPTIAALWDTETNGDPLWLQGWADGLSTYWAVATANRIFVLRRSGQNSVGEWQDVTRASGQYLFGQWQSFAWGNTVIFNNGRDVPQIFNQDTFRFEDLPKWGLISSVDDLTNNAAPTRQVEATCTHLYPLKSFLVASGVTENGLYQPNKIWWSDATALATFKDVGDKQGPPSWDYESPSTLSAQSEIAPESGAIRTAELLNDNLIIYTDAAATALSVVGGANVMASRRLFNKGAASLHSVCEFNNQHFCVSQDQIYIHDGSTVKLIAKDRVEEEFFTRIGKGGRFGDGQVEWALLQAVKNPDRKEIIITYGALGEDIPVNIPDNYSIATGAVQALPATASGTVVVPGDICKEYECDAVEQQLLSMSSELISAWPMLVDPVRGDTTALQNDLISTNTLTCPGSQVIDLIPNTDPTPCNALQCMKGFSNSSNSGSAWQDRNVDVWTFDVKNNHTVGGHVRRTSDSLSNTLLPIAEFGNRVTWWIDTVTGNVKITYRGQVSDSYTIDFGDVFPLDFDWHYINCRFQSSDVGGAGCTASIQIDNNTYNGSNPVPAGWNEAHASDIVCILHSSQAGGATPGLDSFYMYVAEGGVSGQQGLIDAFSQNYSNYVDPNPNCQTACKEYECDAYSKAIIAASPDAYWPMNKQVDLDDYPNIGTGNYIKDYAGGFDLQPRDSAHFPRTQASSFDFCYNLCTGIEGDALSSAFESLNTGTSSDALSFFGLVNNYGAGLVVLFEADWDTDTGYKNGVTVTTTAQGLSIRVFYTDSIGTSTDSLVLVDYTTYGGIENAPIGFLIYPEGNEIRVDAYHDFNQIQSTLVSQAGTAIWQAGRPYNVFGQMSDRAGGEEWAVWRSKLNDATINALEEAFAQNQSTYVDPDPNCVPACKEYECDAYVNALTPLVHNLYPLHEPDSLSGATDVIGGQTLPNTGTPTKTSAILQGQCTDVGGSFRVAGGSQPYYRNTSFSGGASLEAGFGMFQRPGLDASSTNTVQFRMQGDATDTVVLTLTGTSQVIVRGFGVSSDPVNVDIDGKYVWINYTMSPQGDFLDFEVYVDWVLAGGGSITGPGNRTISGPVTWVGLGGNGGNGDREVEYFAIKNARMSTEEAALLREALLQNSPDYVDPNPNCVPAVQAQITKTPRRKDDPPTIQIPRRPGRDII